LLAAKARTLMPGDGIAFCIPGSVLDSLWCAVASLIDGARRINTSGLNRTQLAFRQGIILLFRNFLQPQPSAAVHPASRAALHGLTRSVLAADPEAALRHAMSRVCDRRCHDWVLGPSHALAFSPTLAKAIVAFPKTPFAFLHSWAWRPRRRAGAGSRTAACCGSVERRYSNTAQLPSGWALQL